VSARRVLVLGLARSGEAAALALRGLGDDVVGVDHDPDLDQDVVGRLTAAGVELHLGEENETLLRGIDVVVKSPGVPGEVSLVAGARRAGVPVWSEIELGARLLPNPILGVTGTNGKTTTAALLGEIFRSAGRPVEVAGNIGRPLTSLVGSIAPDDWIVCELSSFQLEDVDLLRPRIAVLLNLEPDHLDRHPSFAAYRDAKLRIFVRQGPEDVAVVPRGFEAVAGNARRMEFSADDPLPGVLRLPGAHNRENAAAAVAAARAAGIGDEAIARALENFPGVEHRIEEIATVRGVLYVNDSKATNVAAALRGIASFDAPLHVIAGGLGKHES
jgi:UDP-N-acetylmuramoylalanine--D-glutamate ligase